MKFAAALTTKREWTQAVEDLTGQVRARFGAEKTDFALLFVHRQYLADVDNLLAAIRSNIGARHLVGCTGGAIIGVDSEIEDGPAISLLVAQLPGVEFLPFQFTQKEVEESTGPGFWHFQMEIQPDQNPQFILLADPFSVSSIQMVHDLTEAFPGAPLVGGLASGGQQPGETRLFLDDQVLEEGAVGIALTGAVKLVPLVSQGCKPIGEPLVVTRAEKNVVYEVGGQPPIKVLQGLLPKLPAEDQKLARTALFIGRVVNEYQEEYGRGDFLIRNLIGQDPSTGALAVGDLMRTGQTVQFQLRDGRTADEDLKALLSQKRSGAAPHGALLFSCLGRGEGMYGTPHHDIRTLQELLGPVPTAGFFCNGEIGPIGDQAYVHGFTSVIALFTDAPAEANR